MTDRTRRRLVGAARAITIALALANVVLIVSGMGRVPVSAEATP